MRTVNHIGKKQEKKLLKYLLDKGVVLGSGSARVVYQVNSGDVGAILGVDFPTDIVVKLGCGCAGYTQNKAEANTYEDFDDAPLARVYALGRFVLIMEAVDAYDLRGVDDEIAIDDDCCDVESLASQLKDVLPAYKGDCNEKDLIDVAQFICKVQASGMEVNADTLQVGRNKDGVLVAYDYGLLSDQWEESVGNASFSIADDRFYLRKYVHMCTSSWNKTWKKEKFFKAVDRYF